MLKVGKSTTNSDQKICIVGCGAMTALGINAAMTSASVRANLSNFRESFMVDKVGEPFVLSMAEYIGDEILGVDRLSSLAMPAMHEALLPLAKGSGVFDNSLEIALYLGTASSRPGYDSQTGQVLLDYLAKSTDYNIPVKKQILVPTGHASSIMAMVQAIDSIVSGKEEIVLVGGVDSYNDADTLEWLDEDKRLHSEINKDGFVPGEGAGFCLLTSLHFANQHKLNPLVSVLSCTDAEEPHSFYSEGICIGKGMTEVLRKTLTVMAPDKLNVDWIICDMNGESYRGKEWTYAYLRTGEKYRSPLEIWHPADCYGDIGAASGAVLASIAIRAWQRLYARGERCLLWTSSDGSHRSAMILQNPTTHY